LGLLLKATRFLSSSAGNWTNIEWGAQRQLDALPAIWQRHGDFNADAQTQAISTATKVVSTDPPYYDNIGYADLSDFFYVWLRRSLKPIFPKLYATLAVPKAEELIATPYRHGASGGRSLLLGRHDAGHAQPGRTGAPGLPRHHLLRLQAKRHQDDSGTHSTGWVTFLEAVLQAGFALTGTWPMRTELGNRMIGSGTNALASSIVLVCRQRALDAPTISRREFLRELNATLPEALLDMTRGGANSP
jgi:putative DNA methylase